MTAHITSGWVDPGFSGRLVLEISNLGKMPVTLYPGMKMCKLLLMKLTSPAEVPYDKRGVPHVRRLLEDGGQLHRLGVGRVRVVEVDVQVAFDIDLEEEVLGSINRVRAEVFLGEDR